MSDLNDLIHTNATHAYNQGVMRERERIIQLLPEIFETYFAKDQIIDEVTKRIMRQEQK